MPRSSRCELVLVERRRDAVDHAGGRRQQHGPLPGRTAAAQQRRAPAAAPGAAERGRSIRSAPTLLCPGCGDGHQQKHRQAGADQHGGDPVALAAGAPGPRRSEREGEEQAADQQGLHDDDRTVSERHELQDVARRRRSPGPAATSGCAGAGRAGSAAGPGRRAERPRLRCCSTDARAYMSALPRAQTPAPCEAKRLPRGRQLPNLARQPA